MEGYARFCIQTFFGWLKSFVQQIWMLFSDQKGNNLLSWIGENWKGFLLILCAAGAVIDLLVYLFRWEPVKVWKSYFLRRKSRREPAWREKPDGTDYYGYDIPAGDPEAYTYYPDDPQADVSGDPETNMPQDQAYPDPEEIPAEPLRPGPIYSAPNMPAPPEYQEMYRRPEQNPQPQMFTGYTNEPGSMTQRNLEKVIGPRRKKLRVNELFRDTDEGAVHYEAPRPVIDQAEAYHTPVFPRNWKDNGENQ